MLLKKEEGGKAVLLTAINYGMSGSKTNKKEMREGSSST